MRVRCFVHKKTVTKTYIFATVLLVYLFVFENGFECGVTLVA